MALCYRDMTYCESITCGNSKCFRNQQNINEAELHKTGLPIAVANFSEKCGDYHYNPIKRIRATAPSSSGK